jgi:hypothetical protein
MEKIVFPLKILIAIAVAAHYLIPGIRHRHKHLRINALLQTGLAKMAEI